MYVLPLYIFVHSETMRGIYLSIYLSIIFLYIYIYSETMRGKEEEQTRRLQKKGLGVRKGSLDPLLALLVQVDILYIYYIHYIIYIYDI